MWQLQPHPYPPLWQTCPPFFEDVDMLRGIFHFQPQWNDDTDLRSSISPSYNSNHIDESSTPPIHANRWSLDANSISDRNEWLGVDPINFNNEENGPHGQNTVTLYSQPVSAFIINDSNVQGPNLSVMTGGSLANLTTDPVTDNMMEPQKPVGERKTRTRRPSSNPIAEGGQNPYGRAGKQRCERCRKDKRKVCFR